MRLKAFLLAAAAVSALGGPVLAQAPAPVQTQPPNTAAPTAAEIVVTAQRLTEARESIQPSIGASTYTIGAQAIEAMPGGVDTNLNQVVLQMPGVVQDSYGQLHVRGDHNGLQYRLNGVILPEGLSVFGQALSPRLADQVQLLTGALPAQYGLRTAGIVDITTKQGFQNGGEVSLYGGSHGLYEPSFEYGGSSGAADFFVSGSYTRSQLGIESPDGASTPDHDRTDQLQGFAYVDRILDPQDRATLILGTSNETFQIPNPVGLQPDLGLSVGGLSAYPSASLHGNQRESTSYAVASFLHTTDRFTGQVSVFGRYSSLTYRPDLLGELLFNGVAQSAAKTDAAAGVQAEGVFHLNDAHTLRAGVIVEGDRGTSRTLSDVLPVDDTGAQTSNTPLAIADNSDRMSWSYSIYLQDEWKLLSDLTLNYGVRFDQVDAYRDENQVSPRANLVWTPMAGTTVHAGYARYFSPSPFELIANPTVARFTGTSAEFPNPVPSTTPYAERDDYLDLGAQQVVLPGLTLGLDGYYRRAKHLIDEGQFGAPIILTPFNYLEGRIYGVEFTASYTRGPFSAYANFSASKAQGEDIVSSQYLFDPGDLAYIASHFIYLDHDQTYTGSAGASYLWRGTRASLDLLYGSGLRADGAVPNGRALADYIQVNAGLSHRFAGLPAGPFNLRLDVINLFDKQYEIRDGTGVGVGAPQWGPRRGVFVGVSKEF